jgi:predicted phage terminase large subunit-like protein
VKAPLYCPHQPTAKQLLFLSLNSQEAFYGGAGGGGKSDALLMGALQYVDVSGYAAIIFRRTYKDLALPGAVMDRAGEWLAGSGKEKARWSSEEKTWHFPITIDRTKKPDATLTFGYLESEADKYRYQSAEFQYIGFDEVTHFQLSQYRYLFSRLRRLKESPAPLRMRAASNPGGIGHEWVKQRFIVEGMKSNRPFIPARMHDNPYLDHAAYHTSLAELDPVTRRQIEEGDWSARQDGNKFKREWFEIVDAAPANCAKVRFWDMAATEPKQGNDPDYTSGCLMGLSPDKVLYICDIRRHRGTPLSNEKLVKQVAELDGKSVPVWMEQEPGSSGKSSIDNYGRRVLMGWDFHGKPSTGSKEERANPLSSQSEANNVKLVRGAWIGNFLDEAEAFPNGAHDDQIDSASGALEYLSSHIAGKVDMDMKKSRKPDGVTGKTF